MAYRKLGLMPKQTESQKRADQSGRSGVLRRLDMWLLILEKTKYPVHAATVATDSKSPLGLQP